jgi:hypothetical protein
MNSIRQHKRTLLVMFLLVATLAFSATLKSVSSFDLPGPAGKRFDYLTIDYKPATT